MNFRVEILTYFQEEGSRPPWREYRAKGGVSHGPRINQEVAVAPIKRDIRGRYSVRAGFVAGYISVFESPVGIHAHRVPPAR